jgi:hypothetical protein
LDSGAPPDDTTPEYMNVLGMIFSMCGLMIKVPFTLCMRACVQNALQLKWCAWVALFCSCIGFAHGRSNDDAKQVLSSFM